MVMAINDKHENKKTAAGARSQSAAKRRLLTARDIATLKPNTWGADPAPRGQGVLQVRKLAGGGVAYYYRYTSPMVVAFAYL